MLDLIPKNFYLQNQMAITNMTTQEKLRRLDYLSSLSYLEHTSEDWDEELRLECELQDLDQ